ncbi:MAG: lycopene cyclase domain-containing protein [Blastochloris sp.]|nr:lycopene cyclase domain-containing protein [Blastochloris sp.]
MLRETALPMMFFIVTYLQFHWIFNLPLLLFAGALAGTAFWQGPVLMTGALVLVVVMIFTTPWDNYAVAQGIWGFPRERYSVKVWHLPVEEYAFFIIESVQVMLLTFWLLTVLPEAGGAGGGWSLTDPRLGIAVAVVLLAWLGLGLWGRKKIHARSRYHYAWHLLFWFVPVILLQWVIAWDVILPRWPAILAATLGVGTYLSWADYLAIDRGIWHFDQKQITGHKIGRKMPWEEAVFFLSDSLFGGAKFCHVAAGGFEVKELA